MVQQRGGRRARGLVAVVAGRTRSFTMLENLESRRLFNAAVLAAGHAGLAADGTLFITGSAGNDMVDLHRYGSNIRVAINGRTRSFKVDLVKAIRVDGGAGDDQIVLGRRNVPATLNGGIGDDTLSAGNGNDSLIGGAGSDYLFGRGGNDTLDGGKGTDMIVGGSGFDTIDVRDASVDVVHAGANSAHVMHDKGDQVDWFA